MLYEMHPDWDVSGDPTAVMELSDGRIAMWETGHSLDALKVDSWSTVDIDSTTVLCYPQDQHVVMRDATSQFMNYNNALVAITTGRNCLMMVTVHEREIEEKSFVTTAG